MNRISTVFASGKLHTELLDALKFMGEVRITQGVGIINKPEFEVIGRQYQKRFLYIGRLSQEKNIALLVHIFNKLPTEYRLNIVGTGPLEDELRAIANPNIRFIGQVENKNLGSRVEYRSETAIEYREYGQEQVSKKCENFRGQNKRDHSRICA